MSLARNPVTTGMPVTCSSAARICFVPSGSGRASPWFESVVRPEVPRVDRRRAQAHALEGVRDDARAHALAEREQVVVLARQEPPAHLHLGQEAEELREVAVEEVGLEVELAQQRAVPDADAIALEVTLERRAPDRVEEVGDPLVRRDDDDRPRAALLLDDLAGAQDAGTVGQGDTTELQDRVESHAKPGYSPKEPAPTIGGSPTGLLHKTYESALGDCKGTVNSPSSPALSPVSVPAEEAQRQDRRHERPTPGGSRCGPPGSSGPAPRARPRAARRSGRSAAAPARSGWITSGKRSDEKKTPDSTNIGSITRFMRPETVSDLLRARGDQQAEPARTRTRPGSTAITTLARQPRTTMSKTSQPKTSRRRDLDEDERHAAGHHRAQEVRCAASASRPGA